MNFSNIIDEKVFKIFSLKLLIQLQGTLINDNNNLNYGYKVLFTQSMGRKCTSI